MRDIADARIAIIGLDYLDLPLAARSASRMQWFTT